MSEVSCFDDALHTHIGLRSVLAWSRSGLSFLPLQHYIECTRSSLSTKQTRVFSVIGPSPLNGWLRLVLSSRKNAIYSRASTKSLTGQLREALYKSSQWFNKYCHLSVQMLRPLQPICSTLQHVTESAALANHMNSNIQSPRSDFGQLMNELSKFICLQSLFFKEQHVSS